MCEDMLNVWYRQNHLTYITILEFVTQSEFFAQKIQFEAIPLVYLFVDDGQSVLDMSTYIHPYIGHAPP